MYSRLSKQTSKFEISFGKNKIRTLPLRNCRSRFEKISNNLLLKVSYRFFYIISQSSFLCYYQVVQFQKVIAAQKTQRPGLSIDGPWVPVNETVIAVSVKKHGWLCERVVQDVLIDPVKWQVSTEQPRHLQLATVGQQRNVGQQSRVKTSNIFSVDMKQMIMGEGPHKCNEDHLKILLA